MDILEWRLESLLWGLRSSSEPLILGLQVRRGGGSGRELTSVVQKKSNSEENTTELYAIRAPMWSCRLSACIVFCDLSWIVEPRKVGWLIHDCQWKIENSVCNFMKFKDGYMISSGQPVNVYTDSAARNVLLRKGQGVLGIKIEKLCLIGIQKNAKSNNTSSRSCHNPFSQGRRRVRFQLNEVGLEPWGLKLKF